MSQKLGLVPSSMVEQQTLVSESYVGGKLCEAGDLVLNRLKAHLGVFARAKQAGVISPDYTVLRSIRPADVRYFGETLRSRACRGELRVRAKGIVEGFWRLYTDDFYDIRLPVPPFSEQTVIVRFLEHVALRTKRFIRAKQALIKLLEDRKQAAIDLAITRGLDSSVPLKPLGSIPTYDVNAGWKAARLWEVARIRSEKNRPELELLSVFLGRGVIPYAEGGGQVHKPSLDLAGYQVVRPGDLVLNNQQAWRGSAGVSRYLGIISPAYVVLKLSESLNRRFADYLFQSRIMVDQFVTASKGVGNIQRDIHMPWLKCVRVPVPSLKDQVAIGAAIEQELRSLVRQASRIKDEIALLREYRTRLIADVVTGKLDVRGAAERLPDELGTTEPLDEIDTGDGADDDAADGREAAANEADA
jgi:type I restriction enzyme, S subunit